MRREKNQYIFASEVARKQRSHRFRNAMLLIVPLLIASVLVANFMISRKVTVEEIRLTILNLPADLEGYSILHLSDLHGARYGEGQKAIQTALKNIRYSCVVMTGDMLGENGDTAPLLELNALLTADVPKYLIPGDTEEAPVNSQAHGSLSVYAEWAEEIQAAGITLLEKPALVTREKGRIWFVPENLYALDVDRMLGVYERQRKELLDRATSLTADDAAKIRALEHEISLLEELRETRKEFLSTDIQVVLTHAPLTEEFLSDLIPWSGKEDCFSLRYASLILAGHYNGGQWRIPFVGPLRVPELGWFPDDKLVQGLSYVVGIPQYISPGLGSDPHYEYQPGRLFNPPKITRIVLTGKAN